MESLIDYQLPRERIAQRPLEKRDHSRLLVGSVNGDRSLSIQDRRFFQLPELLRKGDLLVVNSSQPFPCRVFGRPVSSTEEIELFFLGPEADQVGQIGPGELGQRWLALGRPMSILGPGIAVVTTQRGEELTIVGRKSSGELIVGTNAAGGIPGIISRNGVMPIPPYIRRGRADIEDLGRYRTVFGDTQGSVAAPTAGLHFTPELLSNLRSNGIDVVELTMHLGPSSFLPVRCYDPRQHKHKIALERCKISDALWEKVQKRAVRSGGAQGVAAGNGIAPREGRVVAVGTSVVRALESFALYQTGSVGEKNGEENGEEIVRVTALPNSGDHEAGVTELETRLFITPGFQFRVVDLLVTNFHQPNSTHLFLVSAFFGEGYLKDLYQHALSSDYRFLSYGDAMLLERSRYG